MDKITLRSSVKPSLKKRILFRGSIIASLGFLPLLFFGNLFLFAIAMIAVALGLVPFRKLSQLEMNPHKIHITDNHHFQFVSSKGECRDFSFEEIQSLAYIEDPDRYGIELQLKEGKFFLPLFTKNSYKTLKDFTNPTEQYHAS